MAGDAEALDVAADRWSVSSAWAVPTKRSAKQFARGQRGGIFTVAIPGE